MKLSVKIRPQSDSSDPRPKSRITEEDCDGRQLKTCLYGVQKHLTKSSGFFLFLARSLFNHCLTLRNKPVALRHSDLIDDKIAKFFAF